MSLLPMNLTFSFTVGILHILPMSFHYLNTTDRPSGAFGKHKCESCMVLPKSQRCFDLATYHISPKQIAKTDYLLTSFGRASGDGPVCPPGFPGF